MEKDKNEEKVTNNDLIDNNLSAEENEETLGKEPSRIERFVDRLRDVFGPLKIDDSFFVENTEEENDEKVSTEEDEKVSEETLATEERINEETSENILEEETRQEDNITVEVLSAVSDLSKDEIESIEAKTSLASRKSSKNEVDPKCYETEDEQYSYPQIGVFSILGALNNHSDLYFSTKDELKTAVKKSYSKEKIDKMIEATNSKDFDEMLEKVVDNSTAKNQDPFLTGLYKVLDKTLDTEKTKVKTENLSNSYLGVEDFVKNVSKFYGENRYYKQKLNSSNDQIIGTRLEIASNSELDSLKEVENVCKHIKSIYNYDVKASNKSKISKNSILIDKNREPMDACLDALYAVAKNMDGSKNFSFTEATEILKNVKENDFLSKANNRKVFEAKKEDIKDVISLLTTIFMSRFVFDYNNFPQIEKELSLQATNKMKNLVFNQDKTKDFFVMKLIEKKVLENAEEIMQKNGIKDLNELAEIYDKNGTKLKDPDKIFSLRDFLTCEQASVYEEVKNKKITNEISKEETIKPVKKQSKKLHQQKTNYDNDYLKKLRETPEYRKMLKEYQDKLALLNIANPHLVEKQLSEVEKKTDDNLKALSDLASKNLDSNSQKEVAKELAKNEAISEKIDEIKNQETSEKSEQQAETFEGDIELVDALENHNGVEAEPIVLPENEENLEIETEESELPDISKTYKTQKPLEEMSDEEIAKKVEKHLNKLVDKAIDEGLLQARVKDSSKVKVSKKSAYRDDYLRLSDKVAKKVTNVREDATEHLISVLAKDISKENRTNQKSIASLCNDYFNKEFHNCEKARYTKKDLQKDMAIAISKVSNESMPEELNAEIYVVKDTYRKYAQSGELVVDKAKDFLYDKNFTD